MIDKLHGLLGDKLFRKLMIFTSVVGTSLVAILSPDLIESLIKHVSVAGQSQFARDCFIFSLAAVLHAGRMKKEIRSNFESLTVSIDKVAIAFHEDLKSHSERQEKAFSEVHEDLRTYGDKLDKVTTRVSSLESTKQQLILKEN